MSSWGDKASYMAEVVFQRDPKNWQDMNFQVSPKAIDD